MVNSIEIEAKASRTSSSHDQVTPAVGTSKPLIQELKPIVIVPESPQISATKSKTAKATGATKIDQEITDNLDSVTSAPRATNKLKGSLQTTMKQFCSSRVSSDVADNEAAAQTNAGTSKTHIQPALSTPSPRVKQEATASKGPADIWAFPKSRSGLTKANDQQQQRQVEKMEAEPADNRQQTDAARSNSMTREVIMVKKEPDRLQYNSAAERQHTVNKVATSSKFLVSLLCK